MIKLTSNEVYNKLLKDYKILEAEGGISFYLGSVSIRVKQRDVVGNLIQEWLQHWFEENEVIYSINKNTQMPPDFYLDPSNLERNMLEVKAFYDSPGFDIADFKAFVIEIKEKPYMLFVDYLIFKYDIDLDGKVTIRNIWLKKVWEITRRMSSNNWPLNLQIKHNVVHKIRPGVWYRTGGRNIPMFKSLEHFISAIEQTIYKNQDTNSMASTWLDEFIVNYRNYFKHDITVPRWNDIKQEYFTT